VWVEQTSGDLITAQIASDTIFATTPMLLPVANLSGDKNEEAVRLYEEAFSVEGSEVIDGVTVYSVTMNLAAHNEAEDFVYLHNDQYDRTSDTLIDKSKLSNIRIYAENGLVSKITATFTKNDLESNLVIDFIEYDVDVVKHQVVDPQRETDINDKLFQDQGIRFR